MWKSSIASFARSTRRKTISYTHGDDVFACNRERATPTEKEKQRHIEIERVRERGKIRHWNSERKQSSRKIQERKKRISSYLIRADLRKTQRRRKKYLFPKRTWRNESWTRFSSFHSLCTQTYFSDSINDWLESWLSKQENRKRQRSFIGNLLTENASFFSTGKSLRRKKER